MTNAMNQSEFKLKLTKGAKRGKTCIPCRTRENLPLVSKREDMQPAPSAVKLATGVNHGKTCVSQDRLFGLACNWLIGYLELLLNQLASVERYT